MTPEEQADTDLRALLALPGGRRFLVRLLTQAGLYSSSYAESPTATAYNEGRRSVAIALMVEAQRVAVDKYLLALKEQVDAQLAAKEAEPEEG